MVDTPREAKFPDQEVELDIFGERNIHLAETPAVAVAVSFVGDDIARRIDTASVDERLQIGRRHDLKLAREDEAARNVDRPGRDEAMLAHPARPHHGIILE